MKRKIIIVCVAALAVVVVGVVLSLSKSGEKQDNSAISLKPTDVAFPVKVAIARRGDLVHWINSTGYAYPCIANEIKPNLSGQVVELNVHNGKMVHKGDLLFHIDDREQLIELQQAKDQLIGTQVDFNFANTATFDTSFASRYKHRVDSLRSAYNDAAEKFREGRITRVVLDRIKRDFDAFSVFANVNREDIVANKTGLDRVESQYEYAKLKLSYAMLNAPFDGVVSDCSVEQGSYVQAGQTCMRIMDISKIRIDCEVTETDLSNIKIGDEAKVRFVAFAGKTFKGSVAQINPSIDLQKRTATVSIEILNRSQSIKPGMYATVGIASSVDSDIVVVPKSAVLIRDNRPLVFTVLHGKSQWVYVALGKSNDDYYEIKNEISQGDTLVVNGNYNLAHEVKVKITEMEKY